MVYATKIERLVATFLDLFFVSLWSYSVFSIIYSLSSGNSIDSYQNIVGTIETEWYHELSALISNNNS